MGKEFTSAHYQNNYRKMDWRCRSRDQVPEARTKPRVRTAVTSKKKKILTHWENKKQK
jgi:hypothetical protein